MPWLLPWLLLLLLLLLLPFHVLTLYSLSVEKMPRPVPVCRPPPPKILQALPGAL